MAVKAKCEITLYRVVDIEKITRYYLLQSSTATAPSKPTSNPPDGNWKTTEPSYTSGSTNTLYFVDLTVMTNGSFSYSAVSKSSSYEAAKEAWNKANNAQNTANSANGKIDDLQIGGRNLLLYSANLKGGYYINIYDTADETFKGCSVFKVNNSWEGIRPYFNKHITERNVIKAGDVLTYSVYAKTDDTKDIYIVMLNRTVDNNKGQSTIRGSQGKLKLSNDWKLYSVTFTVTESMLSTDKGLTWFGYEVCQATSSGKYVYFACPKLENSNKPTDYTPAPEDTEEKISAVETVASATAGKFNWLVKSGTSSTDFTLTDRVTSLISDEINLKGLVKFSGLNSETQKKITDATDKSSKALSWVSNNGQKAQSLYSMVSKWAADAISDTTEINGGLIKAHTILAKHIDTEDLFAQNIVASGSIQSDNYKETDGIATMGSKWVLSDGTFKSKYLNWDKEGFMKATGGKIGGWNLEDSLYSEFKTVKTPLTNAFYHEYSSRNCFEKDDFVNLEINPKYMSSIQKETKQGYLGMIGDFSYGEVNSTNILNGIIELYTSRYTADTNDSSYNHSSKIELSGNGILLEDIDSDTTEDVDWFIGTEITSSGITTPDLTVEGNISADGTITSSNINDSGWVDCTYGNGISNYAGNRANQVRVRKVNGVVFISGCTTNSTTWQNHDSFLTFPKEYAPERESRFVMQGSGSNRYLLYIGTNGVCRVERYSNNATMNNTVPLNSWLNVFASWPAK